MSPSLLAVFVCLAAASSVVYAVPCPDGVCEIVARRDPNTLKTLFVDPVLCTCTCDDEGNTLFHESVPAICTQCIEFLLNSPDEGGNGCTDVDVTDDAGNTALHDAAAQCIDPVLNTLIDAGADRSKTNLAGEIPLCVVGTDSPPNPGECGGTAADIIGINVFLPTTEECFLDSTTFEFCPCTLCVGGKLPFDVAKENDLPGVADVIGQDCGLPDLCNAAVPPCTP